MSRARDLAAFVSNADGDIKFDTDTLFIDSSTNRVGISNDTPARNLSINSGSSSGYIQLANTNSGTGASNGFEIKLDSAGSLVDLINRENGDMRFFTNNTERMRIDDSGNVGIGTTSPNTYSGYTALTLNGSSSGGAELDFERDGTLVADMFIDTSSNYSIRNVNSGNISIYTGGSERMRIASDGTISLGTTLSFGGKVNVHEGGIGVGEASASGSYRRMYWNNSNNEMRFWNGSNEARITSAGAFVDASDVSLKKDIADIEYGIDTVKSLQPRKYKIKATEIDEVGFIAQEMEAHVPEVVKSGENPDGDEQKGIAYGQLTAVLTKALQEAIAKIETLETENTAIKARLDALEA